MQHLLILLVMENFLFNDYFYKSSDATEKKPPESIKQGAKIRRSWFTFNN